MADFAFHRARHIAKAEMFRQDEDDSTLHFPNERLLGF